MSQARRILTNITEDPAWIWACQGQDHKTLEKAVAEVLGKQTPFARNLLTLDAKTLRATTRPDDLAAACSGFIDVAAPRLKAINKLINKIVKMHAPNVQHS